MTVMEAFTIISSCVSILILVATVYYIAHAPVNAVRIGRRLNNEQQKDNAKRNLFLTLFAYRGSPIHYDFVNSLNKIDIVFHDTPTVLTAWHNYYNSLQLKEQANAQDNWRLLRIELLSQMATVLDYPQIKQVDMAKHYFPEGHESQEFDDFLLKKRGIDYLKSGAELHALLIEQIEAKQKEGETEPQVK